MPTYRSNVGHLSLEYVDHQAFKGFKTMSESELSNLFSILFLFFRRIDILTRVVAIAIVIGCLHDHCIEAVLLLSKSVSLSSSSPPPPPPTPLPSS